MDPDDLPPLDLYPAPGTVLLIPIGWETTDDEL
jgi:hypothetical protein